MALDDMTSSFSPIGRNPALGRGNVGAVTGPKVRIAQEERRARLGARHHLASSARDPVEVAGSLVGLHSTDPATVFLSTRARVDGFEPLALERALYEVGP